ncbi:hypothetical protein FRC10_007736 [Ceratobasidium sp. 414]|nr:hypothetical protein FRC10_007736 [Ceratobasidium sp. 414]
MDPYSPFGAPDSEILPQRMNSLYPPQLPQGHQQPQQFATVQQRFLIFAGSLPSARPPRRAAWARVHLPRLIGADVSLFTPVQL